jgi:predicted metal-dependent peptidase
MEVCRTGIVFPNGFLGLHVVEIVFGPQIAILGVRQIQSLISHEFAHHKLRHIKLFCLS